MILVIGESCLDVFHYGECERLCPEAPVPVFNSIRTILKKKKSWNAYKDYEPEKIMHIFDKVCLSNRKLSFKRQTTILIQDLPWEIKVSSRIFLKMHCFILRDYVSLKMNFFFFFSITK